MEGSVYLSKYIRLAFSSAIAKTKIHPRYFQAHESGELAGTIENKSSLSQLCVAHLKLELTI